MSNFIRKVKRNQKSENMGKELYMDLVAAVSETKSLYITSHTALRLLEGIKETIALVEEYEEKYPNFTLEVNDAFYQHFLHLIPA